MRYWIWAATLAGLLCFGSSTTWAQAATDTPTLTPTQTPSSTPSHTPSVTPTFTPWNATRGNEVKKGNVTSVTANLLSAASILGQSGGVDVTNLVYKTVSVSVNATCTSYTLVIEGSVDCSSYATLQSIANTDFGAGVTGLSNTFTNAINCLRARITAISNCTLDAVKFHGVP